MGRPGKSRVRSCVAKSRCQALKSVHSRLSEAEADQLLFDDSPLVKRAVGEALDDLKHKRSVTLREYLRGKRNL